MTSSLSRWASILLVFLSACHAVHGPEDALGDVERAEPSDAGPPPLRCPEVPPEDGAACDGPSHCNYMECDDRGVLRFRCDEGAWALEAAPCGPIFCGELDCAAGEICVSRLSGSVSYECLPAPTGHIGCSRICGGPCGPSGYGGASNDPPVSFVCDVCSDPEGCA